MCAYDIFESSRNSKLLLNETYFWTDTIKDWDKILLQDKYKKIILDSLQELVSRGQIAVYGFVIMPNHVHLLWKMLSLNGQEMPHASFNKYTAHRILEDVKSTNAKRLKKFRVEEKERMYRIWQRDPLAIHMDSTDKLEQKLTYIHNYPLQEHWDLVQYPEDYVWSSSKFYETGEDDFGFITHYKEDF